MTKGNGVRNGDKWQRLWLAAFLVLLLIPLTWGHGLSQSPSEGAAIFDEYCAGCHTIGGGDLIGPDLAGVAQKRDPQWLVDFIAQPDKVLASGDPIAAELLKQYGNVEMPNLGLSQEQVTAVIAYLAEGSSQQAETAAPELQAMITGDAAIGEALFLGNEHFENDGPPCMGCHNLGSSGLLGGGALGPDLTDAYTRYTDASLAAALANIPWPTMKPIFTDHPLTPEEQTHLRAFILAEPGQEAADTELVIIGISLAGFIGVVLMFAVIYRRRLRGVRRPLVNQARNLS